MRPLLLIPLIFLFPPLAYAAESRVEIHNSVNSSSSTTSTTTNSTHICTTVNGKQTCYDSDKGGDVRVYNNGTTSTITVNGETKAQTSNPATSPDPSVEKKPTEEQMKAIIASEQAKMKAKMDEEKKKMEEQKKTAVSHSFDLGKFFQNLFKQIFHF